MPANKTVASGHGCRVSIAQQPGSCYLGVHFPFVTSRGSKLIRLSSAFHHGWILDSFQMGDATCYSQSWFGPGLGEIRNIKLSILIGGSFTEKGEHIVVGCNVRLTFRIF